MSGPPIHPDNVTVTLWTWGRRRGEWPRRQSSRPLDGDGIITIIFEQDRKRGEWRGRRGCVADGDRATAASAGRHASRQRVSARQTVAVSVAAIRTFGTESSHGRPGCGRTGSVGRREAPTGPTRAHPSIADNAHYVNSSGGSPLATVIPMLPDGLRRRRRPAGTAPVSSGAAAGRSVRNRRADVWSPMPSTIRPIIVTPDLDRLCAFYGGLLGATETMRYPDDGPTFYVGLRVGDSELGLSSDGSVRPGDPGRMLLSIEVPDVDALLPRARRRGAVDVERHAVGPARGAHQGSGRQRRQPDAGARRRPVGHHFVTVTLPGRSARPRPARCAGSVAG
jgi:catechol 2,3-dioxygenase-like lactoylglutathione lyase family enzyme